MTGPSRGAGASATIAWPPVLRATAWGLSGAGFLVLAAGLVWLGPRAWVSWLLASQFLVHVGVSGSVLIALLYVSGATWGVAFRRAPEALTALLPVGAVAFLLVLVVHPDVYPWVHEPVGGPFKRWWLHWPFFAGRAGVFLAAWVTLTWLMVRHSRRQDVSGDAGDTAANVRVSAIFLAVFAVTFSLSAFDWIMSLEPEWYSTIFAAQVFSGTLLAGLATTTIIVCVLHRLGPLRDAITASHFHDLGKLLFGMSTFWMYLWFSQYMLIWYANIPEEATYYVRRLDDPFRTLVVLVVVLNWVVPFIGLMSRSAKHDPVRLQAIALAVLAGHWADLQVMIAPSAFDGRIWPLLFDVVTSLGAVGLGMIVVGRALTRAPLVPLRDPGLAESLHYHS